MTKISPRLALIFVAAFAFCLAAHADTILYNRSPSVTASPAAYSYGTQQGGVNNGNDGINGILGDEIQNFSGGNWLIKTLSVWAVFPTGTNIFPALALYAGPDINGPQPGDSSVWDDYPLVGNAGVATETSTAYTAQLAGNNGPYSLYLVTFTGLNILMGPGKLGFGVFAAGSVPGQVDENFWLLGSSCGDATCDGQATLLYPDGADYSPAYYAAGSSDLNVQLSGAATPEPTTLMLFGAGLGILGLVRRRRS